MSFSYDSTVLIERLGWTLIHSLWQLALVALLAMVLARVMHRTAASTRYLMLVSMLVLVVALPVVTWCVLPLEQQATLDGSAIDDSSEVELAVAPREPVPFDAEMLAASVPVEAGAPVVEPPAASSTGPVEPLRTRIRSALEPWLNVIVAGWLAGACLFALRPVLSCWTVWRLRRIGVSPVSDDVAAALERVSRQVGLTRTVRLLRSSVADVPMVLGYLRPVILLPLSVASGLPAGQLDAILAHELAHIRRHDYLVNMVQTLIETVFFYHPAVWWLSLRIRGERENCCDDAAVAVTGSRVAYGRALLALEDLRAANPVLALGSHGGSLSNRIRRLFAVDGQRSSLGSAGLTLVSLAALLVGAGIWAAAVADERESLPWGVEQNGLVCRIVPVDGAMGDEAVDTNRAVAEFAKPDDIAFAVELKNVSDKPITVLGVRDGKSDGNENGKLNTSFVAPNLFAFEFTNADGNRVRRTERLFADNTQFMIVRSASTHELSPNQSLKFLLRPTGFRRPMDYRLTSGDYCVKVRYHGPRQEVLDQVAKHWPDEPHLKAWTHEVTSNVASFLVASDPELLQPKLVWGAEKDGLRAAVEFRVPPGTDGEPNRPPGVLLETSLQAIFHVKNVSDKPITFVSESGRQGDEVHVTNVAGENVEVRSAFFSGWPVDVRWNLQPGDVAQLPVLTPSLNDLDQPGQYRVKFTIRFNSRTKEDGSGNVVFPAPGDYHSVLDTVKTPLFLTKELSEVSPYGEIHGRLIDEESGKPVRNAVVACGAIVNDSGRGGGDRTVTDSAGNYRLRPPSPGIYTVWLRKHPRSERAMAPADDGVLVEAGKIASSELRVFSGRYLAGKVVDEDGKPVEHIVVKCQVPHSSTPQKVRAKADGSFAFYVPPCRVHVSTCEEVEKTNSNLSGAGRYANASVDVPRNGPPEPVILTLSREPMPFGSPEWLKRSTPGTEIVGQQLADDVTGVVVDSQGNPIAGALVIKVGGPIVETNESGEFHLEVRKGTQFIMHAFRPGYHVWFGTPTSGDELKIVLERSNARRTVAESAKPDGSELSAIDRIKDAIESNYAAINDHEFVYHAKRMNADGEYGESKRTYRIHIPEEGHPWQYLVSETERPVDGEFETNRFAAFNGKHSWVYLRAPPERVARGRCIKIAGYSWDLHIEDYYQQLLTKSIVGMSFTTLTPDAYDRFWEQKKDKFEYQGQRTLDGHDVLMFKSDFGRGDIWDFHLSAPPHSMYVLVKRTRSADNEVLELIEIEEIGQADGFVYPKKGRWYKAPRAPIPEPKVKQELDVLDFSFDVVEVRHLDSVSQEDWFPEIPAGTSVSDQVGRGE